MLNLYPYRFVKLTDFHVNDRDKLGILLCLIADRVIGVAQQAQKYLLHFACIARDQRSVRVVIPANCNVIEAKPGGRGIKSARHGQAVIQQLGHIGRVFRASVAGGEVQQVLYDGRCLVAAFFRFLDNGDQRLMLIVVEVIQLLMKPVDSIANTLQRYVDIVRHG